MAQSVAEYSIYLVAIVAAVIAIQIFVRRGVMGRLKDAIDYPMTVKEANFSTGQYEANYYASTSATDRDSQFNESMFWGSRIVTSSLMNATMNMTEWINDTK